MSLPRFPPPPTNPGWITASSTYPLWLAVVLIGAQAFLVTQFGLRLARA